MNNETTKRNLIATLYWSFFAISELTIIIIFIKILPYVAEYQVTLNNYYYYTNSILTDLFEFNFKIFSKKEIAYILYHATILTTICTILFYNPFQNQYDGLNNQTGKIADINDIKQMRLNNSPAESISFGSYMGKNIGITDPLSILLIAPPGTGKSQLMIANLLQVKNRSFLVLDIKGEMYEKTSRFRSKISNVFILNIEDPQRSSKFNFLESLPKNNNKREQLIQLITNTIIQIKEGESNPYFPNTARRILKSTISAQYYLCQKNLTLHYVITSIQPPINDNTFKEKADEAGLSQIIYIFKKMSDDLEVVENRFKKQNKTNDIIYLQKIRGELLSITTESVDSFGSVISTLGTSINIFNDQNVIDISKSNDFTFDDIRQYQDKPTTLYLQISEAGIETYGSFIRIFFEMLANFITSQNEEDIKKTYPLTIIADEFVKFGKIERIAQLPETGRSKKTNVVFISQTFQQLKRVYGLEGAEGLKANCAILLVFTTNDKNLAKDIVEIAGKIEYTQQRASYWMDKDKKLETKTKDVINLQKIMGLKFKKVLILREGYYNKPIIAKKTLAFKIHKLKKLMQKGESEIEYKNLTKKAPIIKETYDDEHNIDPTKILADRKRITEKIAKIAAEKQKNKKGKNKKNVSKKIKTKIEQLTQNEIILKKEIKEAQNNNQFSLKLLEKLDIMFFSSKDKDQKLIKELYKSIEELNEITITENLKKSA